MQALLAGHGVSTLRTGYGGDQGGLPAASRAGWDEADAVGGARPRECLRLKAKRFDAGHARYPPFLIF